MSADDGGKPLVVDGEAVDAVRESWLVEDRWWTDRPLRRRYWEVVTDGGRNVVVFRDLVLRESSLPPWRDLLVALRRLEARGEIRGGRFVTGFVGEQFALPEALDELRAVRNPGPSPDICRVAATDPTNLVGILTPGPRVPAVNGYEVHYRNGDPVERNSRDPVPSVVLGVA